MPRPKPRPRALAIPLLALSTLIALARCASPADAPNAQGTLTGIVRDAFTNAAVVRAAVTVDGIETVSVTDRDGRFQLNAPEGEHTLTVVREGYFTLFRNSVDVTATELVRVDIDLPREALTEAEIDARLSALEAGRAHRDSPDDPGLRPEVRAFLRGETSSVSPRDPLREVPIDEQTPRSESDTTRASQAIAGACTASLPAPPRTIRIWRRGLDHSSSSCRGRVDRIAFEDYVKGVLPHEWIASWHRESLRAGALAIRTYSWRWIQAGGKYDCADLDDTTASQVFRNSTLAVTNAAVDATRNEAVVRSGRLVSGEYSAENSDPTADGVSEPLCHGRARQGHGRGMCQWGTSRWANAGRSYVWMAQHYWPGASVGCGGDADRDGALDGHDNCPRTSNASQSDRDRDGDGDACDNCVATSNASQSDRDGDGDGDACDNCPRERNSTQADGDRDGLGDVCDNCPSHSNRDQRDTDRDGHGDACDDDDDNDSVSDSRDNCSLVSNRDQRDTDHDGHGDACDDDDDADGVSDSRDNCRGVPNRDQRDTDRDGHGDACDDSDGDGLSDSVDLCPTTADPGQEDLDGDSHGDACDDDDDNDGVNDTLDVCAREPDPSQIDTDRDGRGDACDDDLDGDGVINGADNCASVSNPDQSNQDNDLAGDACDDEPQSSNPEDSGVFVHVDEGFLSDASTDASTPGDLGEQDPGAVSLVGDFDTGSCNCTVATHPRPTARLWLFACLIGLGLGRRRRRRDARQTP